MYSKCLLWEKSSESNDGGITLDFSTKNRHRKRILGLPLDKSSKLEYRFKTPTTKVCLYSKKTLNPCACFIQWAVTYILGENFTSERKQKRNVHSCWYIQRPCPRNVSLQWIRPLSLLSHGQRSNHHLPSLEPILLSLPSFLGFSKGRSVIIVPHIKCLCFLWMIVKHCSLHNPTFRKWQTHVEMTSFKKLY